LREIAREIRVRISMLNHDPAESSLTRKKYIAAKVTKANSQSHKSRPQKSQEERKGHRVPAKELKRERAKNSTDPREEGRAGGGGGGGAGVQECNEGSGYHGKFHARKKEPWPRCQANQPGAFIEQIGQ